MSYSARLCGCCGSMMFLCLCTVGMAGGNHSHQLLCSHGGVQQRGLQRYPPLFLHCLRGPWVLHVVHLEVLPIIGVCFGSL